MGEEKDVIIPKPGPLSKIEQAGEQVMEHLIELARTSDLTHGGMAKRINEVYGLDINRKNVEAFFKANAKITQHYLESRKDLAIFRAKLTMEHREQLVTDIRDLNLGIGELKGDEGSLLEIDKKWKQIGDLIDKKGRLLLREARLSGKITERGAMNIDKMQVNVFNHHDEEETEIMKRLKKFRKEKEKVIDVEANENSKTDN